MKARKVLALVLSLAMAFSLAACGGSSSSEAPASEAPASDAPASSEAEAPAEAKDYTIATVVKLTGVAWFDRMEVGVNQFAEDTGIDAFQVGDSTADPAAQAKIIEDMIAQGVDAICVVPNSTESLEAVLQKAREAGIVVIAHEAANIKNADYDIEAFDNTAYGEHFMEKLGELMGGKGQYTTFVGSLTATSHNEWCDGSLAYQEANFPDMELVSPKNETTEDAENAYQKTKELLAAYPELVGFQGSAMTDVPGAARAIEEAGKADSTFVVGTSLVSTSGQYLETGAIDMISFWDPALAGYAMNELAVKVLDERNGTGEAVADGLSLTADGYQNLKLVDNTANGGTKVFYASAWIDVTKENMNDPAYQF